MAPYLCQWEAIKYAKEKGCTLYDFWGVAETDDPADPWSGITRFKEGFGGEKVIFAGGYDMILDKLWYNCLSLLARIRRLVQGRY
jgi:lipid II:glycine glycyltransferase (peptidoglycan interpeptide bridge formation enzyme)